MRLALFACLAALAALPARADKCDPKDAPDLEAKDSPKRVVAIKACLLQVSTQVQSDADLSKYVGPVTKVFTYGSKAKFDSMRKLTPAQFASFQVGLVQRREERHAMTYFKDLPKTELAKFVTDAKKVAAANHDLDDLAAAWVKAGKPAGNVRLQYQAAAFAKLYPRFIEHIGDGFADKGVEKTPSQKEGEAIGAKIPTGFDSTAGMGIYFALDGVDSSEHTVGDAAALACPVPGLKVVNLDTPAVKAALMKAKILLPDNIRTEELVFISSPSRKNLWNMPADTEKAAKGMLVAFRPQKRMNPAISPYIVDKFAIDYRKCWDLSIKDFQQCKHLKRLLSENLGGESVAALLKRAGGFKETFFNALVTCARQDKAGICPLAAKPGAQVKVVFDLNKADAAKVTAACK